MDKDRNKTPPRVRLSHFPPSNLFRISDFGFRIYRPPHHRPPRGAIHWAVLSFLLAFSALLLLVIWYYLVPAADAARVASPPDKARLRAVSALLLAVILFVLLVGLILTFRVGRFFFPRPPAKPIKTEYVDAWAESGKRLKIPPSDPTG